MRLLITLTFVYCCCGAMIAYGQLGPASSSASGSRPSVIPPSPEAKLMARYIETPVSTYTGIPQIQLPIDNITSGNLQWNVALSYHAGGHKVEDHASRIGLGWSNTSLGMVGRGVRGLPDELPNIGFIDYSKTVSYQDMVSGDINSQFGKWTEVSYNCGDVEPDYFYFSLNGANGKILYDWGSSSPIVDADRPWKAIPQIANGKINQWTLTSDMGVKYIFQAIEETVILPTSGITGSCMPARYNSAWYLTQIIDANDINRINFTYSTDKESISTNFRSSQYYTLPSMNNHELCAGPSTGSNVRDITYLRPILKKITTNKNTKEISFIPGGSRTDIQGTNLLGLGQIVITDKFDDSERKFELHTDYSTGRLTLKKLVEIGQDQQQLPAYQFSYNGTRLPSVDSYSQDHWGFCNGPQNANSTLLPRMWLLNDRGYPVSIPGSNREPDERYVGAGILEQITFPSGAITQYDFEINDFSSSVVYNPALLYEVDYDVRAARQDGYTNNNVTVENAGEEAYKVLHFEPKENVVIEIETYAFHNGPGFPDKIRPYLAVYDNRDDRLLFKREFLTSDEGQSQEDLTQTFDVFLKKGSTYRVVAYAVWDEPGAQHDIVFFQVSEPSLRKRINPVHIQTGGVRVNQITDKAFPNDPNPKIRRYEYTLENGSSSGVIYMLHNYVSVSKSYVDNGEIEYECNGQTVQANNVANIGSTQGSHVGYRRVTEYYGMQGEYGQAVYQYTSPLDYPGGIHFNSPYPPFSDQSYKTGLLIATEYKEKKGDLFETYLKDSTEYLFHEYKIPTLKMQNWGGYQGITMPHKFETGVYSANIGHAVRHKVTRTELREGREKTLTTTTHYDSKKQRIRAVVNPGVDGDSIKTVHYYPDDFTQPGAEIREMVKRHIIGVPLESVQQLMADNQQVLSSNFNQYTLDDNQQIHFQSARAYRPNNAPLDATLFDYAYNNISGVPLADYHLLNSVFYNEQGNMVTTQAREGDIPTSYLWGYNHSFPIASVLGVDYPTLTSIFSASELSKLQTSTLSPTEAVQLYDLLKLTLPDSHFQIYTYDVLFGITSVIDSNGQSMQYTYDSFGRLETVKDFEGNVVTGYEYKLSRQD